MERDLIPEEEIEAILSEAAKRVSVGSRYRHYKNGNTYLVKELAIMRYTGEPCVIYEAEYGKHLTFVRKLEEWFIPGEIDGKEVERFQKI